MYPSPVAYYLGLSLLLPIVALVGYRQTKAWAQAAMIWLLLPVAGECLVWGFYLMDDLVTSHALMGIPVGTLHAIGLGLSGVGSIGLLFEVLFYHQSRKASHHAG